MNGIVLPSPRLDGCLFFGFIPALVAGIAISTLRAFRHNSFWSAAAVGILIGGAYAACLLRPTYNPPARLIDGLGLALFPCLISALVCWRIIRFSCDRTILSTKYFYLSRFH
jgi:uncharacterized membrane protein HdeD (DUF308 family)